MFTHKAEEAWLRSWVSRSATPAMDQPSCCRRATGRRTLCLDSRGGEPFALLRPGGNGPAVLIFFRHFGCGCAWERADRLRSELKDLTAAGATVIGIGQADPERTRQFREETGLTCPSSRTKARRAYEAFGASRCAALSGCLWHAGGFPSP